MPDTPQNRATAARVATAALISLGTAERHSGDILTQTFKDTSKRLRGEIITGNPKGSEVMTVGEIWNQILKQKKREVGESTYTSKWEGTYCRILEDYNEEPLTKDTIHRIFSNKTKLHIQDKKAVINALKAYVFKTTGDTQLVDILFKEFTEWSKETSGKVDKDEFQTKCYTAKEIQSILSHYSLACPKDSVFLWTIRLLYALGCRPSELAGLQWKHVDYVNRKVCICQQFQRDLKKITETKTSKVRYISLTESAYNWLWELNVSKKPTDRNEYVLPLQGDVSNIQTIAGFWRSEVIGIPYLIKTGIVQEYYPLYSLRHSFITHALERGNSIETVAYNCGHSVETCRRHYVDSSSAKKRQMI